ncbi:MAG: hypothetical protein ACP6IY_14350 [Promethearchaeia archaeon]
MNDKISHDSNQIEVGINIKKGEFVFLIIILFLFPISVFIIQQFTIFEQFTFFEGNFLEYIILIKKRTHSSSASIGSDAGWGRDNFFMNYIYLIKIIHKKSFTGEEIV